MTVTTATGRALGRAGALIALLAGMAGLRLDRPGRLRISLSLSVATAAFAAWMTARGRVATLAGLGWALYYIGNGVLLGAPVRLRWKAWMGEARAVAAYETVLGALFLLQGFALAAGALGSGGTLPLDPAAARPLAILLFAVGLGCKLWATRVAGLDIYYYRDLFLGRPVGPVVVAGPYRWLRNPMYGVGNLHGYATALWTLSAAGLAWAAFFHLSIYVFYWTVEHPFVERAYPGASTAGGTRRRPSPSAGLPVPDPQPFGELPGPPSSFRP